MKLLEGSKVGMVTVKKGFHITESQALTIVKVKDRIEKKKGHCAPKDFVRECKKKSSPGYGLFDWNKSNAAEAHWVTVAGYYLRGVAVIVVDRGGNEKAIRATVSVVNPKGERGYVSIDKAATDPSMRLQMISDARQYLVSFQDKYGDLTDYCERVDEIVQGMDRELDGDR